MVEHKAFSAAVVGCTGLVGKEILKTLLEIPVKPEVYAIARRALPSDGSPKLKSKISIDTSTWTSYFKEMSPTPDAFFSGLGTTRGQAGSFVAQRAIDHDLNVELAKAAKDAGVKVYILISSSGASASSLVPYTKMKGETENAVKEMGFPYTIIVRPGLLVGDREDSRPAESIVRGIAKGLGSLSKGLVDFWAQDGDVIGKATVNAAMQCIEGKRPAGLWEIGQSDIIRLGRTEWK
ncbi:MAG: Protein fmp52, mitochondrial [Icmadophila ericetorum]|nr:Protein fmp52, mitochondrial [Icmadophila ericetorum]